MTGLCDGIGGLILFILVMAALWLPKELATRQLYKGNQRGAYAYMCLYLFIPILLWMNT